MLGISLLEPLYQGLGWVLANLYAVVPNLGVCIILLTCIIMLALFPLTAKQAKSMMSMQRAQPKIKELQAKYKNDRQKLNEEMMAFYKENKINPLAGCLPLLIQMPIFIALFRFLREPYKHVPLDSKLFQALCNPTTTAKACGADATTKSGLTAMRLDVPHFTSAPPGGGSWTNAQLVKLSEALPHAQHFLGLDLNVTALGKHSSIMSAFPYFFMVALVVGTGILQQKQTQRQQVGAPNPQMMMVAKVMPVFFGLIALSMPAGLVLYFFVSNVWRLGQQELIMRKIAVPDARQKPGSTTVIDTNGSGNGNGKSVPEPGRLGRLLKPAEPAAPPPKPEASASSSGSKSASKPAPTPARRQKKRRK